jgi:hypothetical protein
LTNLALARARLPFEATGINLMGRKLRVSKAKEQVSDIEWDFLNDKPLPETFEGHCLKYDTHGTNEALWNLHKDVIIAEHAKDFPGSRPPLWWQYSAPRSPIGTYKGCAYDGTLPEPRKRLGGVGTEAYLVLNVKPRFAFGLPCSFIDASDVAYYNRTGLFAGVAPNKNSTPFAGVAIDENDLPRFESEAAFLDRHNLFLPGEKRRVPKADFEPETMAYVDDE